MSRGGRQMLWRACAAWATGFTACAWGQSSTLELDPDAGTWLEIRTPEPGTDEWVIVEARRALASGEAGRALRTISPWLASHERTDSRWLPDAYLVRGDARAASGAEYQALYDYEAIARQFPGSDVFIAALEREMEIATRYLNGLRRKFLGVRIEDGAPTGVELLMRIQERAPGSALAEEAAWRLADYFYRTRQLDLASEMYDIFQKNYPQSGRAMDARMRQIYSTIGRFKGPAYDSRGLVESGALIEGFREDYPDQAEDLGLTDALVARLDESAAAQKLSTAEWYLRRGDRVGARVTLVRLARRHEGTLAAARAREVLEREGWAIEPEAPASAAPEDAGDAPPTDGAAEAGEETST